MAEGQTTALAESREPAHGAHSTCREPVRGDYMIESVLEAK